LRCAERGGKRRDRLGVVRRAAGLRSRTVFGRYPLAGARVNVGVDRGAS
jgi:hypothetical protein